MNWTCIVCKKKFEYLMDRDIHRRKHPEYWAHYLNMARQEKSPIETIRYFESQLKIAPFKRRYKFGDNYV